MLSVAKADKGYARSREARVLGKDERLKIKFADMAQSVERVLGKDEVTSSNLVISSKKRNNFDCFFFLFLRKKQGSVHPCNSNSEARVLAVQIRLNFAFAPWRSRFHRSVAATKKAIQLLVVYFYIIVLVAKEKTFISLEPSHTDAPQSEQIVSSPPADAPFPCEQPFAAACSSAAGIKQT